jgi:hypothetical protein
MRPGVLRQALVVVGCGALAVTASACESTQSESAKIAREGGAAQVASTLRLGAVNRDVRASDVTLLSGGGRQAVAVKLTSTSSRTQREVPLLVKVTGAGGKVVYSNASGAEALLSHVTLLRPHSTAWWVDDEVLATGAASSAKVSVGTGHGSPRATRSGALSANVTGVSAQGSATTVSGVVANHTGQAQSGVPVFAMAVRGGKVVAAGRAVVASLPAHAGAATFDLPLIGDATGAKIELSALPGAAAAGGGLK